MPTVGEYRNDFYYFTGKASDVARQLAFAGFGIIWVFTDSDETGLHVPDKLLFAGLGFAISLTLDLIQYLLGALIWRFAYRYIEDRFRKLGDDTIYRHEPCLEQPITIIFWIKCALVLVSYALVILFILGRVIPRLEPAIAPG